MPERTETMLGLLQKIQTRTKTLTKNFNLTIIILISASIIAIITWSSLAIFIGSNYEAYKQQLNRTNLQIKNVESEISSYESKINIMIDKLKETRGE